MHAQNLLACQPLAAQEREALRDEVVAAAPWASFLCMGGSGSFCDARTCAIADHGWAGARHALAVAGLGVLVLVLLCRSLRV